MITAVKYNTIRLWACDKTATAAAVMMTANANAQLKWTFVIKRPTRTNPNDIEIMVIVMKYDTADNGACNACTNGSKKRLIMTV